jgi:hypothetical protein
VLTTSARDDATEKVVTKWSIGLTSLRIHKNRSDAITLFDGKNALPRTTPDGLAVVRTETGNPRTHQHATECAGLPLAVHGTGDTAAIEVSRNRAQGIAEAQTPGTLSNDTCFGRNDDLT